MKYTEKIGSIPKTLNKPGGKMENDAFEIVKNSDVEFEIFHYN